MDKGIVPGTALVTGSEGFIGKALVAALIKNSCTVWEVDQKMGHDILSPDFTIPTVERIFHLAAVSTTQTAAESLSACLRTNIDGTMKILEAASTYSNSRTPIVYLPTSYQVEWCSGMTARDAYSTSKACCDLIGQLYRLLGLNVVIVRHHNVFGPGDTNVTRFIPKTILRVLAGLKPIVGADERNFLYIDDLVDFYTLGHPPVCLNRPSMPLAYVAALIEELIKDRSNRQKSCFETQLEKTIDWYRDSGLKLPV